MNEQRVKSRPIGVLALWLKRGHDISDKDAHQRCKRDLTTFAWHSERKAARAELWALRGNAPEIEQMFRLEVGFNEDPLMEPLEVV